jgi:hypothetical protein
MIIRVEHSTRSFVTRILPKRLRSGDTAVFASLDDHSQLFSMENAPSDLCTATVDFVHDLSHPRLGSKPPSA